MCSITWGQGEKSGRTKGIEGEGSSVGKGRIGRVGRVNNAVVVVVVAVVVVVVEVTGEGLTEAPSNLSPWKPENYGRGRRQAV